MACLSYFFWGVESDAEPRDFSAFNSWTNLDKPSVIVIYYMLNGKWMGW